MLKKRSLILLILLSLVAVLTVLGCGRKGSLNPNTPPFIEISDYSGIARPDTVITDSAMFHEIGNLINPDIYDSLFYQEIYWKAWDIDGVVKSYAYRIGTWDSLSNSWHYDKAYGVRTTEDGWIEHLQPNGTYGIWTPLKQRFPSTAVYFQATDTLDYKRNFGKFDVKCKDNYGEESVIASRYFCSWSDIPQTSISTNQGNVDSCRVGTKLEFEFNVINDNDPFNLGMEAAYYKYRIAYVERVGAREDTLGKGFEGYEFSVGSHVIRYQDNDSTWKDTKDEEDPSKILLTFEPNDINELTQLQVKAVDKAGIEDPNYKTMSFFVRGYFYPETCPFMSSWDTRFNLPKFNKPVLNILSHVYVLGENYYMTYLHVSEEIPTKYYDQELRFANQFYMNKNGELTALWSDDIELYMRWRYLGQHLYDPEQQRRVIANQTYAYDPSLTNFNNGFFQYYCNIEYMEIQLDGDVNNIPPIGTIITDPETGRWRRIPIHEEQNCKLFGLSPGEHTFSVRAVDNQGAVDKTPEELVFTLVEPPEEKEGIFIIHDTGYNPNWAPQAAVETFYENLIANVDSITTPIEIIDINNSSLTNIKFKNNDLGHPSLKIPLSPTDIIDYKLLIWDNSNFNQEIDQGSFIENMNVLIMYLHNGGNLFYNGTSPIKDGTSTRRFFENYCGFSPDNATLNKPMKGQLGIPGTCTGARWIGATSKSTYDLIYNRSLLPPNYLFNALNGYTLFDVGDGTPIYVSVPDSTLANPNNYEGNIGVEYEHTLNSYTSKVFVLGIPLYYMELDGAQSFIHYIFDKTRISYNNL